LQHGSCWLTEYEGPALVATSTAEGGPTLSLCVCVLLCCLAQMTLTSCL
jgi:hypothetical protein